MLEAILEADCPELVQQILVAEQLSPARLVVEQLSPARLVEQKQQDELPVLVVRRYCEKRVSSCSCGASRDLFPQTR
jgi:hypothetical protein